MPRRPFAIAAAACAANSCAYAVVNTTPLLIGALMSSFKLDEGAAGGLVTVELLCMGVIALIVAPWMTGARKRHTALAAALLVLVAQAAAAACGSLPWMLAWLALLGLGVGLLLAALNAIIASTTSPDRLFGYAFMAAYGITAGMVFVIAPAIARAGHAGAYGVLAVFTLLCLPLIRLLPRGEDRPACADAGASASGRAGFFLLGGIAIIGTAMMGFYAFIERLGVRAGLPADTIATVFAIQQIASVLGSAAAAACGLRFGLVRSLLIGTALHTLAILIAVFGNSLVGFTVGVIAEGLTFLFILPLQFTLASQIDASGRWAAAANGAFFISTGIAPFLLGWLIGRFDYPVIAWLMLGATPLGMLAFAAAGRAAARVPAP